MEKRKKPAVVDYSGDTADVVISGKKRARSEMDAEREAYLRGSANHVLAAAAGKYSSSSGDSGPASKKAKKEDGSARPHSVIDTKSIDFTEVFRSVHSFGASAFTGKEKKIWEMKQLNALGANLKHKEKMPLKMWLGVSKARKERAEKKAADEKAAGIVTGKKLDESLVSSKKRFHGGGGDDNDDYGDGGVAHGRNPRSLDSFNMRGPVMFVKQQHSSSSSSSSSSSGHGGGGGGRGGGGRGGFGGGRGRGGFRGGRGRGGGGRGRGR